MSIDETVKFNSMQSTQSLQSIQQSEALVKTKDVESVSISAQSCPDKQEDNRSAEFQPTLPD